MLIPWRPDKNIRYFYPFIVPHEPLREPLRRLKMVRNILNLLLLNTHTLQLPRIRPNDALP